MKICTTELRLRRLPLGIAPAIFLLWPALAAHDLAVRIELHPPAAVVRALYGGSEPVAFAKVTVHAPGAANVYQSGNADAQGYFVFRPSEPGGWTVTLDDEMGHVQKFTVPVPDPFTPSQPAPDTPAPWRLERALLGLSLLIGLSGFWYGFRARRA